MTAFYPMGDVTLTVNGKPLGTVTSFKYEEKPTPVHLGTRYYIAAGFGFCGPWRMCYRGRWVPMTKYWARRMRRNGRGE